MDKVRIRRVAEMAATMSDKDLAWMLKTHRILLEQYRENLEFEQDALAALEAEAAGREKRGQGRGNLQES